MSETEQQEGEGHIGEQFSGVSLVSVFGGHRLHPTTWAPTEPPKLVPRPVLYYTLYEICDWKHVSEVMVYKGMSAV